MLSSVGRVSPVTKRPSFVLVRGSFPGGLICFAKAWRQKTFQGLKTELSIRVPKMKASLMLLSLTSHVEGNLLVPLLSGRC